MTKTTTGADIIGQMLAGAGATHAFGIPGGEVLALMQGMNAAGLSFVLVKHENNGGFFAEGHWHVTGTLPVLVATLGPGVANAVNVVANAMQDRVPLIFLTGCINASDASSYTHQIFDHQAVLRPIVKGSFRLERGAIVSTLAEALALAQSGQAGPVHVDVPIDVAESETHETIVKLPTAPPPRIPDFATLESIKGVLSGARNPIALAGVDAVNANAGAEVSAFCREHHIPLITTYKGKGLLDENDPLSLGGAGLSPLADSILLPLVAKADVILLLGYDPIEMRIGWRNPWGVKQAVIEVAPDRRSHGMHRVDHLLIGDIRKILTQLAHKSQPHWRDGETNMVRLASRRVFEGPDNWGPHAVFRILRDELPADTIATADSGAHRILFSQMWSCTSPRSLLQSSGLCTMACALPLAGGAKMGRPAAPVLCVIGDAGLEMCIGELATLRDRKLPVIVCVLVDRNLALIELKQRNTQRPRLGIEFGGSDFTSAARAFGGYGAVVTSENSLRTELALALIRPTFTVIAADIGPGAYDGAL